MSRILSPPMKLLTIAILAVLPAFSAFAGPQAVTSSSTPQQRERSQSRDNGSLSDAVRRVERDTRGEVLSAERVQYDGRDMHRVKVVDDEGRVRVFMQDPNRRSDDASGSNRRNNNASDTTKRNDRSDGSKGREPPTRDDDG